MSTELYPGIPFSPQAALADNVGAADTIIKVTDISALPDAPNLATIGTDEMGETVLYAAKTAEALSGCVRGVEGTARAWSAGETIGRNFTAKDHADLIAAVLAAQHAVTAAQGAVQTVAQSLADHEGDSGAHADIREALDDKQPLLTGQPGQVVGFDADGAAVAQDAPDQADAVTVPGGGVMELGPELGDGPYTFELTPEEESAISAAQVSYDGTQSGIQAETVQEAVDALADGLGRVSGRNLLDNWYFADPINQRGQTEYTGGGYTIDRWAQAENSSFELSDNGLAVVAVLDIYQRLENPMQYLGKTVTFSILVDGAVYHATGTIPNSMPSSYANVFGIQAGDSILDQSAVNMNQDHLWCTIKAPVGSVLKAAKLELGPVQTLARRDGDGNWVLNDPPPDKALELLKCQRYYQIFATQSMRPTKAEDFRPPMRANPALGTIQVNGVTYYTADASL